MNRGDGKFVDISDKAGAGMKVELSSRGAGVLVGAVFPGGEVFFFVRILRRGGVFGIIVLKNRLLCVGAFGPVR